MTLRGWLIAGVFAVASAPVQAGLFVDALVARHGVLIDACVAHAGGAALGPVLREVRAKASGGSAMPEVTIETAAGGSATLEFAEVVYDLAGSEPRVCTIRAVAVPEGDGHLAILFLALRNWVARAEKLDVEQDETAADSVTYVVPGPRGRVRIGPIDRPGATEVPDGYLIRAVPETGAEAEGKP